MESLVQLAEKYETAEFINGDPSWFMHQVEGDDNRELMAFIASCLSYGSRKQFLPKIQHILDCADGDIKSWLLSGQYANDIPSSDSCYYRLYTYAMMNAMLKALAAMIEEYGSMKNFLKNKMNSREEIEAIQILTQWFVEKKSNGIIPSSTNSSCKRLCMFLRWMVRDNSPVDLGIWADIIDKKTLIIPMDTHVVQEANRLGLTSTTSTSMSAARRLTKILAETFPDDPTKADFALFGLGVDTSNQKHS